MFIEEIVNISQSLVCVCVCLCMHAYMHVCVMMWALPNDWTNLAEIWYMVSKYPGEG